MRRLDRQISEEESRNILSNAEYGILSTVSNTGRPYGVPLSFCVTDDEIFFHCAEEGQKLDHIDSNAHVSFCVVGKTEILPEKFSTKYESVIVSGKAEEVFENTKRNALKGLLEKYSASFMLSGMKHIDDLIHKTKVYRITISSISGKARKQ